jgi:hypothetical protein
MMTRGNHQWAAGYFNGPREIYGFHFHSSFAFLRLPSIPLHRPSFCLKILENILRAKQTERKENQEIAYFLFTYFLYFILKKIQFQSEYEFY